MVSDFEKKGLHPNDALLLLTANGRSLSDNIRYFRHICHAPMTIGTFLVSAGAAVITPQRRFTRAPQGSPKSLGGREEVSLSPHAVTATRSATSGFQACVDRSGQPVHHLLGLSFLAARLIRSYMGYVPEMPSIQLSSCTREIDPLTYFPVGKAV